MNTFFNVSMTMQILLFVCILGLFIYSVYQEYTNKFKKHSSLWQSIKIAFYDRNLYELWGVGVIIMFILSILFTKLILIFNFLESFNK